MTKLRLEFSSPKSLLYSPLNSTTISFLPPLLSPPTGVWFSKMMGALVEKRPQREFFHPTKPSCLPFCLLAFPSSSLHPTHLPSCPMAFVGRILHLECCFLFITPSFHIIPDPVEGSPTPRSILQLPRSRTLSLGLSFSLALS